MKTIISLVASVLVLAAPVAAAAQHHRPAHHAAVAIATARATALRLVPGRIRAEELEREHGRWIYSFEIEPAGVHDHTIREVNIDSDTGQQVGPIEVERG